jgi:hypothetical protein
MTKQKIVLIFALLSAILSILVPFCRAEWSDYRVNPGYDGYSQSWQSYKQQNPVKTNANATFNGASNVWEKIGNWFSSAVSSMGNFLKNVAVNTYRAVKNFSINIYNNVHNFFVKAPDIRINTATAPPRVSAATTGIEQNIANTGGINSIVKTESGKSPIPAEQYIAKASGQKPSATPDATNIPAYAIQEKRPTIQVVSDAGKLNDAGVGAIHESPVNQTPLEPAPAKGGLPLTGQENIAVITPHTNKTTQPRYYAGGELGEGETHP